VDTTTIIRIVAGCLFLAVLAAGIAYIAFLSGVLSKCAPSSRTMQPGTVWLLLIPLFNLIWHFTVVTVVAKSLGNEFRLRNIPPSDPEPGKRVGIAMCICGACGIIPILNLIAIIPHLVLWIVYWAKIAEFSRKLDQVSAPSGTPTNA
jgi:hypothetical protein